MSGLKYFVETRASHGRGTPELRRVRVDTHEDAKELANTYGPGLARIVVEEDRRREVENRKTYEEAKRIVESWPEWKQRYASIREMTDEDRQEIFDFAKERSNELLGKPNEVWAAKLNNVWLCENGETSLTRAYTGTAREIRNFVRRHPIAKNKLENVRYHLMEEKPHE